MKKRRILSNNDIQQAITLRRSGLSNRKIARLFGVSKTTIFNYAFKPRKRSNKPNKRRFVSVPSVVCVVVDMRVRGFNSLEISQILEIPLADVNYIFSRHF